MWFKKKNQEYKEYKLEFFGSPAESVEYFITVYSGNKKLRLCVDSGCSSILIANPSLKGCSYSNTGTKIQSTGVYSKNSTSNRLILLDFTLTKPNKATEEETFNMLCSVVNKKDSPMFANEGCDGLLGATFLQFCEVDFRNGFLRVYKERKGRVFNKLLKDYKKRLQILNNNQ